MDAKKQELIDARDEAYLKWGEVYRKRDEASRKRDEDYRESVKADYKLRKYQESKARQGRKAAA